MPGGGVLLGVCSEKLQRAVFPGDVERPMVDDGGGRVGLYNGYDWGGRSRVISAVELRPVICKHTVLRMRQWLCTHAPTVLCISLYVAACTKHMSHNMHAD